MIIRLRRLFSSVSDKGNVIISSKEALKLARNSGYTGKDAVVQAKKHIDHLTEIANNQDKNPHKATRESIGFKKREIGIPTQEPISFRRKIGFKPDYTEENPQPLKSKIGFLREI